MALIDVKLVNVSWDDTSGTFKSSILPPATKSSTHSRTDRRGNENVEPLQGTNFLRATMDFLYSGKPYDAFNFMISGFTSCFGPMMNRFGARMQQPKNVTNHSKRVNLRYQLERSDFDYNQVEYIDEKWKEGAQGRVSLAKLNGHMITLKKLKRLSEVELNCMRGFDHPNIVDVFGIAFHDNSYYISMEYCKNGDLYEYLRKTENINKLTWFNMIKQIAQGMSYLHCINIVHRDLKTKNILLANDLQIKLCDFGTATQKKEGKLNKFEGTINYMAPEVLLNEQYDEKVDVYSFGATVYEMMVRTTPFKKYEKEQIIYKVGRRIEQIALPNNVPDGFHRLINECLCYNSNNRPSFNAILNKLDIDEFQSIDDVEWVNLYNEWKKWNKIRMTKEQKDRSSVAKESHKNLKKIQTEIGNLKDSVSQLSSAFDEELSFTSICRNSVGSISSPNASSRNSMRSCVGFQRCFNYGSGRGICHSHSLLDNKMGCAIRGSGKSTDSGFISESTSVQALHYECPCHLGDNSYRNGRHSYDHDPNHILLSPKMTTMFHRNSPTRLPMNRRNNSKRRDREDNMPAPSRPTQLMTPSKSYNEALNYKNDDSSDLSGIDSPHESDDNLSDCCDASDEGSSGDEKFVDRNLNDLPTPLANNNRGYSHQWNVSSDLENNGNDVKRPSSMSISANSSSSSDSALTLGTARNLTSMENSMIENFERQKAEMEKIQATLKEKQFFNNNVVMKF